MNVWIVFSLYDRESESVESVHAIEQDALDEAYRRTNARTGWALLNQEYYVRPSPAPCARREA